MTKCQLQVSVRAQTPQSSGLLALTLPWELRKWHSGHSYVKTTPISGTHSEKEKKEAEVLGPVYTRKVLNK